MRRHWSTKSGRRDFSRMSERSCRDLSDCIEPFHEGEVTSMLFSDDGRWLATGGGSEDGKVLIFRRCGVARLFVTVIFTKLTKVQFAYSHSRRTADSLPLQATTALCACGPLTHRTHKSEAVFLQKPSCIFPATASRRKPFGATDVTCKDLDRMTPISQERNCSSATMELKYPSAPHSKKHPARRPATMVKNPAGNQSLLQRAWRWLYKSKNILTSHSFRSAAFLRVTCCGLFDSRGGGQRREIPIPLPDILVDGTDCILS